MKLQTEKALYCVMYAVFLRGGVQPYCLITRGRYQCYHMQKYSRYYQSKPWI